MKIGHELEQMNRQVSNILQSVDKIPVHYLPIIRDMMKETSNMLRVATDAYILQRSDLASETIGNDKIVNELNRKVIRAFIRTDGGEYSFAEGFHVTRVAKALERIGDYVKNVAKEVIFIEGGVNENHDFA